MCDARADEEKEAVHTHTHTHTHTILARSRSSSSLSSANLTPLSRGRGAFFRNSRSSFNMIPTSRAKKSSRRGARHDRIEAALARGTSSSAAATAQPPNQRRPALPRHHKRPRRDVVLRLENVNKIVVVRWPLGIRITCGHSEHARRAGMKRCGRTQQRRPSPPRTQFCRRQTSEWCTPGPHSACASSCSSVR